MEGPDVKPPTSNDPYQPQLQLTSLSPELKCAIFTSLPDVTSAKSLALTSSSFYYTFLDAQSLILTQVLQNEITTDLLHGAFAAYKATKTPVWTKQAVQDFLAEYFGKSVTHETHRWNLSEALHMSKIHSCVDFFATEFASFALSKNRTIQGSNVAPSFTEMIRIRRVLYRFELYCNLFRKPGFDRMLRGERNCLIQPRAFEAQEQRGIFWDMFSPWENEQLGCIHDYLIEEITILFNDVAEHDVDWGELHIEWVDTFGRNEIWHKEGYLLKGLEFIFQLVTTTTYDDRHRLFTSNHGSKGSFLSDALTPSRVPYHGGAPLEEYNEEEERMFVSPPFDDDLDSGPAEAWRWAHATCTKDRFYFLKDHRRFRQRGYVMWDYTRLLGWNFFDLPIQALPPEQLPTYSPERFERETKRKMQKDSFTERERIWAKGGRGWWAPGDESHIRWPQQYQRPKVSLNRKQGYFLEWSKNWKTS